MSPAPTREPAPPQVRCQLDVLVEKFGLSVEEMVENAWVHKARHARDKPHPGPDPAPPLPHPCSGGPSFVA